MDSFFKRIDNSFLREAVEDKSGKLPNRNPRAVLGAHYVPVEPVPLQDTYLVTTSPAFLQTELGLAADVAKSADFMKVFAADHTAGTGVKPWATPYALNIYGEPIIAPDPMTGGNGYGDGRAASFAEVVAEVRSKSLERSTAGLSPSLFPKTAELAPQPDFVNAGTPQFGAVRYSTLFADAKSAVGGLLESLAPPALSAADPASSPEHSGEVVKVGDDPLQRRWEFQWKGSGPTPFCRGADGRAVLRSSIREFLASEYMAACGIPTTRAAVTIGSKKDTAARPWYYGGMERMGAEPCAITTRVSPSFVRIGHIELFARRVRGILPKSDPKEATERLYGLVRHAIRREFPQLAAAAGLTEPPAEPTKVEPLPASTMLQFLEHSGAALCDMVGGWMNVGYVQSNFNSDNVLVGGRTMDYGPFGYVDAFQPFWIMWTGGGDKFSFFAQPQAAVRNFHTLAQAVASVMAKSDIPQLNAIIEHFAKNMEKTVDSLWRRKLGFPPVGDSGADPVWERVGEELYTRLFRLMAQNEADWTMMWRRLANVVAAADPHGKPPSIAPLDGVWYKEMNDMSNAELSKWANDYVVALREACAAASTTSFTDFPTGSVASMRAVSPMYQPREHLLRAAYTAAKEGDLSVLHRLQEVLLSPYEEGTKAQQEEFDVKTPDVARDKAGIQFMSCSS